MRQRTALEVVTKKGSALARYEVSDRYPDARPRTIGFADIWSESGKRIAVLEDSGPNRDFVLDVVCTLGHRVSEFARTEDLVSALISGARFDSVLASFDGDQNAALTGARILRRAAGVPMPVLLMMHPEQIRQADTFVMDAAIDFVMVPCEECEMVVRVSASIKAAESLVISEPLVFGRYLFDPRGNTVTFDDGRVRLKPREFDLALFLFRNAGVKQSRDAIFDAVWSRNRHDDVGTRTIDVHIANIRRKLRLKPESGERLSSVYGHGYLLSLDDE
ncbi:winged-helix domain-containing protein [Variovorax sp. PAMC26660]|uniref:winged helix-turn-helix transcriptional regulator n=1 Tax=Variovorax sp. PAMC26660 TaxID=2762322 RepID=UPI00164D4923|nr:response regulator transcription factor [Variovorax sp. PAMC26660]QNK71334.1 response regulator transcription factor [Variovorax sp. PAMC26660]